MESSSAKIIASAARSSDMRIVRRDIRMGEPFANRLFDFAFDAECHRLENQFGDRLPQARRLRQGARISGFPIVNCGHDFRPAKDLFPERDIMSGWRFDALPCLIHQGIRSPLEREQSFSILAFHFVYELAVFVVDVQNAIEIG